MKSSSGHGRLGTLRFLAQRFSFLVFLLLSLALMVLGRSESPAVGRLKLRLTGAVAPVLDVIASPASAIADAVTAIRELGQLRQENARLRAENARLMHWQTVARQLDSQNRALQSQLNYIPEADQSFVTVRVIGDTGGPFVHAMLLSGGEADGLHKGQVVISGEAVVGRIIETGPKVARMLLLTDINSHVPVMLESSRAKAMLAGDNSDRPRLLYLSPNSSVAPGDRVVTSGHGGTFPPGMPVGVVSSVNPDGGVRVDLLMSRHNLDYVSVVEFGLPGALPSDSDEGRGR